MSRAIIKYRDDFKHRKEILELTLEIKGWSKLRKDSTLMELEGVTHRDIDKKIQSLERSRLETLNTMS